MIYLQYIKNFGGNVETLYDILEVSRKASKEVIEKAYKTLAKKYHPDLQTAENKEIAEKRMKEINEAYDVLSDEQKRKEYDEKLEAEDERKKQEEYINYQNNSGTQSVKYESDMQFNNSINTEPISENNYNNQDFDWRKAYANLSKKEQRKIMKEVQKEANAEYRKQYEENKLNLNEKINISPLSVEVKSVILTNENIQDQIDSLVFQRNVIIGATTLFAITAAGF